MAKSSSRIHDAQDEVIGQDHDRVMKSTGPAKDALSPQLIEPVDRPVDPEWAQMMQFNKDDVEVYIQPTNEKDADQVFQVFVNGQSETFKRGETKTVKRYFVDKLARCKVTTFGNKKIKSEDGTDQYVYPQHTGLRYPFSVTNDPHPRGRDWLRSVLNEA